MSRDSFYEAILEARKAAQRPVVDFDPGEDARERRRIAQAQQYAQSANQPVSKVFAAKIDPYYTRDPKTNKSPARVEAAEAQEEARIAREQAAEALRKALEAERNLDTPTDTSTSTSTDTSTSTSTDTSTSTSTDTSTSTSTDTSTSTSTGTSTSTSTDTSTSTSTGTPTSTSTGTSTGIGAGAGGSGPDAAAQKAIMDQIKALTDQIAKMQNAAAIEAAKPKVVGTRTVRKKGGIVEVVQVMSDGSTGNVLESYKDLGARDSAMKMFENAGLDKQFSKSLMDIMDKVYEENIMPTEAQVLNTVYNSDAYKTRFAGNEIIRKRMADGKGLPGDRLLSPSEYVKTEDAYREIMSEAGLPSYFYDQPEDFAKFIGELGTSVAEIAARVNLAKQALQNADQNIKNSLKQYYGLSEGDMVAYLLDPDKAFRAIDSRFTYTSDELKRKYQASEIGGAATRAGMQTGISKDFAEEILKAGKGDSAERAFQSSVREQEDYQRLMGLYGETAGTEDLTREALALAGGADVGVKIKKLASKERAKFQQQSALNRASLGSRSKRPDV